VFDMQTRPELVLLQKTMVVVEGVARGLNPSLNMWSAAEPVAREWIEANLSPLAKLRDAGEGAGAIGKLLADLPSVLEQGRDTALALAQMAGRGVRLDEETVRRLAAEEARQTRWGRLALWVGALSLALLAITILSR
jgi:ubiquinone biosynthesis protein